MPTAQNFGVVYLEPPTPIIPHPNSYDVASALYGLVQKFNEGHSAASAQAYVAGVPRYTLALTRAQQKTGNNNILTDYQAITSP